MLNFMKRLNDVVILTVPHDLHSESLSSNRNDHMETILYSVSEPSRQELS